MIDTRSIKRKQSGYLRWKEQLEALKKKDIFTVKRLAQEAQQHLEFQDSGRVQLTLA